MSFKFTKELKDKINRTKVYLNLKTLNEYELHLNYSSLKQVINTSYENSNNLDNKDILLTNSTPSVMVQHLISEDSLNNKDKNANISPISWALGAAAVLTTAAIAAYKFTISKLSTTLGGLAPNYIADSFSIAPGNPEDHNGWLIPRGGDSLTMFFTAAAMAVFGSGNNHGGACAAIFVLPLFPVQHFDLIHVPTNAAATAVIPHTLTIDDGGEILQQVDLDPQPHHNNNPTSIGSGILGGLEPANIIEIIDQPEDDGESSDTEPTPGPSPESTPAKPPQEHEGVEDSDADPSYPIAAVNPVYVYEMIIEIYHTYHHSPVYHNNAPQDNEYTPPSYPCDISPVVPIYQAPADVAVTAEVNYSVQHVDEAVVPHNPNSAYGGIQHNITPIPTHNSNPHAHNHGTLHHFHLVNPSYHADPYGYYGNNPNAMGGHWIECQGAYPDHELLVMRGCFSSIGHSQNWHEQHFTNY